MISAQNSPRRPTVFRRHLPETISASLSRLEVSPRLQKRCSNARACHSQNEVERMPLHRDIAERVSLGLRACPWRALCESTWLSTPSRVRQATHMNAKLARIKRSFFLHRWWKQWLRRQMDSHGAFLRFPPYGAKLHELATHTRDPVRFTTMALALHTVCKSNIPGSLAEVGVFRGDLSRVLRQLAPERKLYLFDTFEGFPNQDLDAPDGRFKDTNLDRVKAMLGDLTNVFFRVGYFPDTTAGLEGERFAFVMLDADKFKPTLAGLEFFYPRLSSGGYVMIHDYNSPESDYAVSKAVDKFIEDKPEQLIGVADPGGSVLF